MRTKMFSKTLAVLGISLVLIFAAACGGGNTETGNSGNTDDEGGTSGKALKVALLTPGPINDNGWNATAYAGLMKIKEELGAETAYSEKVGNSDAAEFIRGYAEDGYDVIIGHGFEYGDVMKEIAPDFEKTWFLVNSSTITQEPNLTSLSLNNSEQGYLMGSIAALLSKTGTVAAIGGSEIPPITKGLGGIEAAEQKGVLAIGSNQDQNSNGPDTVATSVIQDYPEAMKVVVERIKNKEMKAESQLLGVKDGAIYLAPYHGFEDKISQEIKDKINAIVESLKSGSKVITNE
ncbi:BMP family protein [Paenibacillus sp. MCAF20]